MKHLIKYTWSIVTVLALAACVKEKTQDVVVPEDPNEGKELISFAGDGAITKASLTKAGFGAETKVVMRIKAEEVVPSTTLLAPRWAKATATATANITSDQEVHYSLVNEHSDLNYDSGEERYWDDAFGRNSKLTVYAFAIPGKTDATLPTWPETDWQQINATTNQKWYTGTAYTQVSWSVSAVQNSTTMGKEDLTYSNNISAGGTGGRYTHAYSPGYDVLDGDNPFPKTLQDALVMGDGMMRWWPKTIANATERTNNTFAVTTGKFDQGHLIFNHALAWIEINLKEGAGFNNSATSDFGWTANQNTATQNIALKGFNTTGTLDVSNGNWSGQVNNVPITQMVENSVTYTDGGKTTRKLYAYVIPGTVLYENESNVVEFEIDNAKYYVKGSQIATAIRDYYTTGAGKDLTEATTNKTFTTIEAGKHYVINLTVAKKGIDKITAALVDWETVNSNDADAKNTYPTFTFEDRGDRLNGTTNGENDGAGTKFNIYRAAWTAVDYITSNTTQDYTHWTTGYGNTPATKTWDSSNSVWSTGWFWENNLTAYHFRAAGYIENASGSPSITINTNTTPDPDIDYFSIASGALSGSSYKDYIWGAPFKDIANDAKLTYSTTTGFDNEQNHGAANESHQISYAIGSTESTINMLLFHMTSQIFINVQTTADDSPDKVNLFTDAEHKTVVEILRMKSTGTVQMGDGMVDATGEPVDATAITYTGNEYIGAIAGIDKVKYSYGLVPQVLSRGDGETNKIGLRITTPDGNQYVVKDMSTCKGNVTTSPNSNLTIPYADAGSGLYYINRWYPNYQYTYTITIKKTGIERITAAVVPWETVTGDLGTIDLEN